MKRGKELKSVATAPSRGGEIMTMQEAADYLHCHYTTIYRLVRRGVLSAFRLGGDYRFHRADIDEWIARQSMAARHGGLPPQKGRPRKEQ